jgi:segregation and condensation protein B
LDAEKELEARQKVEGALFLAGRFLRVDELVALTEINPLMVKKVLSDLESDYSEGRGMVLIGQNGQWKMDIHPEHVDMVNKLATGSSEFSVAEQETLALLAHKKEMKQSILVRIRGNKAYDHVKRFVEMGLVHKKRVGHTAELTLQDKFHDYFRVGGSGEQIEADSEGENDMEERPSGDLKGSVGEGVVGSGGDVGNIEEVVSGNQESELDGGS